MIHLPITVAYFFFLGFWLYHCHRSDAPPLHPIHPLMSQILLVKSLTSLTSPIDLHDDLLTQFVRISLILALTILLVETTRASLVPLRQTPSKKVVTVVLAAQIVANVAVGEFKGTSSAIMAFMAVNVLGGFSVLGCMVWHVAQLGEGLKWEKKMEEERRAVDSVGMLLLSYIKVVALSYAMKVSSYPLRMVNGATEEIASLVCYAVVFYWFRPEAVKKSEFFVTVKEVDNTEQSLP